jgi:hypothetical protein
LLAALCILGLRPKKLKGQVVKQSVGESPQLYWLIDYVTV